MTTIEQKQNDQALREHRIQIVKSIFWGAVYAVIVFFQIVVLYTLLSGR